METGGRARYGVDARFSWISRKCFLKWFNSAGLMKTMKRNVSVTTSYRSDVSSVRVSPDKLQSPSDLIFISPLCKTWIMSESDPGELLSVHINCEECWLCVSWQNSQKVPLRAETQTKHTYREINPVFSSLTSHSALIGHLWVSLLISSQSPGSSIKFSGRESWSCWRRHGVWISFK